MSADPIVDMIVRMYSDTRNLCVVITICDNGRSREHVAKGGSRGAIQRNVAFEKLTNQNRVQKYRWILLLILSSARNGGLAHHWRRARQGVVGRASV